MPEIRASFARGVGIQIEKVGQNVAGEVHNAVGHFVVGTKCLLTILFRLRNNQTPAKQFISIIVYFFIPFCLFVVLGFCTHDDSAV